MKTNRNGIRVKKRREEGGRTRHLRTEDALLLSFLNLCLAEIGWLGALAHGPEE